MRAFCGAPGARARLARAGDVFVRCAAHRRSCCLPALTSSCLRRPQNSSGAPPDPFDGARAVVARVLRHTARLAAAAQRGGGGGSEAAADAAARLPAAVASLQDQVGPLTGPQRLPSQVAAAAAALCSGRQAPRQKRTTSLFVRCSGHLPHPPSLPSAPPPCSLPLPSAPPPCSPPLPLDPTTLLPSPPLGPTSLRRSRARWRQWSGTPPGSDSPRQASPCGVPTWPRCARRPPRLRRQAARQASHLAWQQGRGEGGAWFPQLQRRGGAAMRRPLGSGVYAARIYVCRCTCFST
jgi:hypothetical protein